jgi:hypothetical protein
MAEEKNLLRRGPYLKPEDWEAIAAAMGTGPSGLLPEYDYYRDAARDVALLLRDCANCPFGLKPAPHSGSSKCP